MWKCLSPVLDYSPNFNLLQFQYERWLYQIVSGSIDSEKKYNLCLASVLSQKPFCHSFWRWLHALLIDTVERLGYPDFFLTMSANEWDLHKPWWNASRFQRHGLPPTQDSFAETISILCSSLCLLTCAVRVAENGLITCLPMQSIPERRMSRPTFGGWNFRDVAHRTCTV